MGKDTDLNGINFTFIPISREDLLNDIENIVRKCIQQLPQPQREANGEIIFINDVCILTGYRKSCIYALVNQKKIPFIKPAGVKKLIFKRSEILQWLINDRKVIPSRSTIHKLESGIKKLTN
jgi:excisionase family DNA binding protein